MADIWGTTLTAGEEQTGEYPVLPAGTYTFEVENIVGKEYTPKPTSKIGHCAQIDLRLRCEGPATDVRVFESLFSDPNTIWKMTQFAKCIGVYYEGMTPRDLLKAAEGGIGKANLIIEEYNGKKRNRVKAYLAQEKTEAPNTDNLPF